MSKIPLSVPSLQGNELKYVEECINTDWVSSAGKYVDIFEQKVAEFTGAGFAVACVNGTSALQLSLKLAGVKDGDEVIVPTITFIAPINAVKYNNATPIFMDVDNFYTIDLDKTIDFIKKETFFKNGFTFNKITNRRIKAIIPVHVFGNAIDFKELVPLCREYNINIVEDAAESMGTHYRDDYYAGKHTGTVGLLGCLSFNGNKIITTGGGGMILTDNEDLAKKATYLTQQAKDDNIRYIHNEVGYNFRLSNIQSAIGVAQLEQLQAFLSRKRKIFHKYRTAFSYINGITIVEVPSFAKSNHWMNVIQIDKETYGENIEEVMERLTKNDVQTRPVWSLNHLQEPYKDCQYYKIDNAKKLVNNSLCLPSSSNLSNQNIDRVIDLLARNG